MPSHPYLSLASCRCLVMLSALFCLSCSGGGGLNPVQGKVLYKNQPIQGALVSFHPKGPSDLTTHRSVGATREDGSFTLTTGQSEGAPAGEYVVTVIWSAEVAPKNPKVISTAPPETFDRLGGAYSNPATSTIKVEIKKGVNQLEPFHLK